MNAVPRDSRKKRMQVMKASPVARKNCPRCRDGEEVFYYFSGEYLYDVDKARSLLKSGREVVEVEDDSVRESLDGADIDEGHLDHVDPTIPGIIAHIERLED